MATTEATGNGLLKQTALKPSLDVPNDPAPQWIEERTRVAVGREANVSGKLIFTEPVRIEGRFRGDVSAQDLLVLTEGSTVEGKVHATRLVVMGELRGDVSGSKRVVLGRRARVIGNIEAESLTICEGAQFEGRVTMPKVN